MGISDMREKWGDFGNSKSLGMGGGEVGLVCVLVDVAYLMSSRAVAGMK